MYELLVILLILIPIAMTVKLLHMLVTHKDEVSSD